MKSQIKMWGHLYISEDFGKNLFIIPAIFLGMSMSAPTSLIFSRRHRQRVSVVAIDER